MIAPWKSDSANLSGPAHRWFQINGGRFAVTLCCDWMLDSDLLSSAHPLAGRCPQCERLYVLMVESGEAVADRLLPHPNQVDWVNQLDGLSAGLPALDCVADGSDFGGGASTVCSVGR